MCKNVTPKENIIGIKEIVRKVFIAEKELQDQLSEIMELYNETTSEIEKRVYADLYLDIITMYIVNNSINNDNNGNN